MKRSFGVPQDDGSAGTAFLLEALRRLRDLGREKAVRSPRSLSRCRSVGMTVATRGRSRSDGVRPSEGANCMEALMIGVSGLRGTIGGTLTPGVVMRMASAFAAW